MSVDAAAADRLPWLPDDPAPQLQRRSHGSLLSMAAAAVALVAAGGFWIGSRSVDDSAAPVSPSPRPSTTVALPPPHPATEPQVPMRQQPQVLPAPVPEVRPAPARQPRISVPPAERRATQHVATTGPSTEKPASVEKKASATPTPAVSTAPSEVVPKPWNPRVVAGAAGRLVQVGAFGSVHQAKRGWWFMVHDYPAMAHLPAVVRETRNSKGTTFYRFDVGTTSQAHSEVVCQRMTKIDLSCAVVGLPWKAKVER